VAFSVRHYIDANNDGAAGTDGLKIRIHPALAVQDKNSVWTFDGTLPPKLLMARYGESLIFRHYNALPIDIGANNGFGRHTISTHEHNGHNPAESDGFMHAYSHPGQFYDYHWPMVLAGHDSINSGALDPKTGAPDGHGGITQVPGDWHETMSTHWFHDHMLDYTAQNVYKGNAAMMNYYSAIDRGREPVNLIEAASGIKSVGSSVNPGYACHYANPTSANLCLPSGSGLDWGNRDYDVNLVMADKAWDAAGQLKFNIFNVDGFLGDRMTVNWEYKPYMDVRARRYRFRMLNGAVSRDFKVAVVKEATSNTGVKSYTKVPFHMIANDGNLMQHAIPFPNAQSLEALPEQGIAERYDIIVDFKGLEAGTKLYMVNILEHQNGTGPARILPLADVLGAAVDGVANKTTYVADGVKGDPVVGKFLEFRVAAYTGTDLSLNPVEYTETVTTTTTTVVKNKTTVTARTAPGNQMIPLNKPTAAELQAAVHRTFAFGRSAGTDASPWTIKTDDNSGGGLSADPSRVSAAPELPATPSSLGKVEIWHITGAGGWTHPVHVHFEEGQILKRGGVAPPIWEKYARKDVYRVGPIADSTTSVDMAIRFREFAGT
jgi:FtsP/CotA-like multicopper oxidase with cupredoxin domain